MVVPTFFLFFVSVFVGAVKKQPIKTTQLPLQEKFEGATAFFMLIVEKLSNYLKTGYNEQARRKNAFFALINIYFIDSSGGF